MTPELSQLGLLLFISAIVAMLTRRLHTPYTVGLVLAGMALYLLPIHLTLHLSKDLIFSVFLPPLVFEAALYISWAELKKRPTGGGIARDRGPCVRFRGHGYRHALRGPLAVEQRQYIWRPDCGHRPGIRDRHFQGSSGDGAPATAGRS